MSEVVGVMVGIVKWFSFQYGYGHAVCNIQGNDTDVFIHHNVLPGRKGSRMVQEGDSVTMEVSKHMDGDMSGKYFAQKVLRVERNA